MERVFGHFKRVGGFHFINQCCFHFINQCCFQEQGTGPGCSGILEPYGPQNGRSFYRDGCWF